MVEELNSSFLQPYFVDYHCTFDRSIQPSVRGRQSFFKCWHSLEVTQFILNVLALAIKFPSSSFQHLLPKLIMLQHMRADILCP